MNKAKQALAMMLVAALGAPHAVAAQTPRGPVSETPATDAEAVREIRLTFEGQRPADLWAVFGSGPSVAGEGQPGRRIIDLRTNTSVTGRPRAANLERALLAKVRPADESGAGQGPCLFCGAGGPVIKKVLIAVAVTVGCILLVALAGGETSDVSAQNGPLMARR